MTEHIVNNGDFLSLLTRRSSTMRIVAVVFVGVIALACRISDDSARRSRTSSVEHRRVSAFPDGSYWFTVKVNRFAGRYVLLANGFPIEQMNVNVQEQNATWSATMQPALIGRDNTAQIEVRPYLRRRGSRVEIGPVEMHAYVEIEEDRRTYHRLDQLAEASGEGVIPTSAVDSIYRAWTSHLTATWKRVKAEHDSIENAFQALRRWRDQNPLVFVTNSFDNRHGPDFSALFEEAPVIEGTPADSARLKDYAMHLRDLMNQKKGGALFDEVRPALVNGPTGQKSADVNRQRKMWKRDAVNGTGWFASRTKYDAFNRDDVTLRKWSNGRVWEVSREGGDPLLGGWNLFVANVDGRLKIVRLQ